MPWKETGQWLGRPTPTPPSAQEIRQEDQAVEDSTILPVGGGANEEYFEFKVSSLRLQWNMLLRQGLRM